MSERLSVCKLAEEGHYSIAQLARDFGISRKTVYKWIGRYRLEGETGIFDQSKRPDHSPGATSEEIVKAILELKDKYGNWGPRKIRKLLVNKVGDHAPSISTVGRILSQHSPPQPRYSNARQEAFCRFERALPNDLWQIDFTSPIILPSGGRGWPVPILDDRSRYCTGLICAPDCSTVSALRCFREAAGRYGMPTEMLSDHGSAFGVSRESVSVFTAYLWALQIEHTQGRYAHPQTQGKLERFNQTLQKECIRRHTFSSLSDWDKCFEEFRYTYNYIRPHESLCDQVPASCYNQSERAFVEPDRDYREPGEGLLHRRVDVSGRIWILQHRVHVGAGLAGWMVSAVHEGGGIWTIRYRGRSICQASLTKPAAYKPRP
ncbi:MAG: IS481 family transposase [Dehalococcoidia bacterium]|nr:IS481 family transposase [Dehalococcoidia bacterium]